MFLFVLKRKHQTQLIVALQKACMAEVRAGAAAAMSSACIKLSTLVSKVQTNSIIKLNPTVTAQLAKFVVEMGAGSLVDELVNYVALNVDSQELQVSPGWYDNLCVTIPKSALLLRKNFAELQHCKVSAQQNIRPQPDTCRFFSNTELAACAKRGDLLKLTENAMSSNRTEVKERFEAATDRDTSIKFIRSYEHEVTLMFASKPKNKVFDCDVTGVLDAKKLIEIRLHWLLWVAKQNDKLAKIVLDCNGYAEFRDKHDSIHADGGGKNDVIIRTHRASHERNKTEILD